MIRELNEEDRAETIALLSQASEYNLYALGNLKSVGLRQPELSQFWGDFDAGRQLRAVVNRYMNGWVVYGDPHADWAGLAAIIDQHPIHAGRLQDNPGGIDTLMPYIQQYEISQESIQTFMGLNQAAFVAAEASDELEIRQATIVDIPSLIDFYADAGHMSRSAKGVTQPVEHTRLWLATMDGVICSAALTNAETDHVAMIGGVYTPPHFRNRGHSGSVCSALCADLLSDGKRPVLYWETPAAGAVYKRLGFQEIGEWRALHLQRIP